MEWGALVNTEKPDPRRRAFVKALAAAASVGALGVHAGMAPTASLPTSGWPVWLLQSGGSKIYLMGETPPRATDWHDAHIEQLFGTCASLWTETNQVYREPQDSLMHRFAMDSKRPLSRWLSAEDQERLRAAAAYCKLDPRDLEPYRPWCAASLLQDTYYTVSGAKGASADHVLRTQASRSRRPTFSEFPVKDDVFAWFARMTPAQEVQFLRYTLDEILVGPRAGALIYDDWAAGKIERATAEVARFSSAYPDLAPILTSQRNQRWLPRFKSMFGSAGIPMVVVGLYHMVGPEGLLAMIQRQGVSISRA